MSPDLLPALRARASDRCELCGADADLAVLPVGPGPLDVDHAVLACPICRTEADPHHWRCLRDAMWGGVVPVQVFGWRVLQRLTDEAWAQELLDQVYLDDETLAAARATEVPDDAPTPVVDAYGAPLADGDTVLILKDLDVKGASFTARRGTVVKNIRLGDDPTHVEGKVGGVAIYLKTMFLKRHT